MVQAREFRDSGVLQSFYQRRIRIYRGSEEVESELRRKEIFYAFGIASSFSPVVLKDWLHQKDQSSMQISGAVSEYDVT